MVIAEPPGTVSTRTLPAFEPQDWDDPDEITCVLFHSDEPRTSFREHMTVAFSAARSIAPAWGWMPVAGMALFWLAVAIEPLPADPAPATLLENILGWTFFLGIMGGYGVGAWAAFKGMRWGLLAALPASLLFALSIVSCPVSGHHNWGLWNAGTFSAAFAALALNVGALRYTRRG